MPPNASRRGQPRASSKRTSTARVRAEVDAQALAVAVSTLGRPRVSRRPSPGGGPHVVDRRRAHEAAGMGGQREHPPRPARRVAVDGREDDDHDARPGLA